MTPTAARHLAESLIATHLHAQRWHFAWNRRKRSLGLCRYREQRIELSLHFVLANDEAQVRETVLHEIAHALAGEKAGHGPRWKSHCLALGCKPERCDKGIAIMPTGRWSAQCPSCGKQFNRHRRPHTKARYWCRHCGPAKGPVVFAMQHAA